MRHDAAGAGLRPGLPAAAAILAALIMVLLAAWVMLSIPARQLTPGFVWAASPTLVISLAAAGLGLVIARHQPHNPIGWLSLGISACFLLSSDAGLYAVAGYRSGYASLPLRPLGLLLGPSWSLAVVTFPLMILLFPDGRLPSRHWRWVLWAYLAVAACWPASLYAVVAGAIAGGNTHVLPSGDLSAVDYPAGAQAWLLRAEAVILPVLAVFWLAFVVRQVLGWRGASGERRQQLKWLMSGAAVCMVCGTAVVLLGTFDPNAVLVSTIVSFGVLALPVGIGVGILKYRLYEIDQIISRTLAYTIVTGLLVGVYAGLVLLATHVLPFSGPAAVAASTLAAAALFSPLRRRVQRAVDRRFNRARYNAERTVAAFAARLKDAVDLDMIRDDLAGAVHQALEPTHVWVWISQREGGPTHRTG